MTQQVLNSGQLAGAAALKAGTAVSYLDAQSAVAAQPGLMRPPRWPVLVLGVGGLLTLVWDGFLLWQFARLVALWLGSYPS
jgi:hypothetical protein